jgi:hypothetical protein
MNSQVDDVPVRRSPSDKTSPIYRRSIAVAEESLDDEQAIKRLWHEEWGGDWIYNEDDESQECRHTTPAAVIPPNGLVSIRLNLRREIVRG